VKLYYKILIPAVQQEANLRTQVVYRGDGKTASPRYYRKINTPQVTAHFPDASAFFDPIIFPLFIIL